MTGPFHHAEQHLIEELSSGVEKLSDEVGGPARRRVILLLAAVLALAAADSATVGAAATQLRASLGISNTEIGLLVALSSGIGALATIPVGSLVDHHNRTRLLAGAVGLWGVAMAASSLAPTFPLLMAARLGLGAVSAVGGPAVASLLGDFFYPEERSRIYGLVLTGELIGAGLGFAVAGGLASISWRACFAALIAPALVLAWMVHRLPEPARGGPSRLRPGETEIPEAPAGEAVASRPGDGGGPGREIGLLQAVVYVLRVRTNVVLIVSGALSYFFFAGLKTFGVEFATEQYHVSHGVATLLTLVLGLGAVVGVITCGRLGDRIEHPGRPAGRILVAIGALAATTVIFAPALLATSPLVALPLLMAAAAALGGVNPPLDAARLEIMPAWLWGRAEAVRSVLRQGAESLAPLVFGLVADKGFGGSASGLRDAFLVMLVPLAGAAAVLVTGLRTYPRDVAGAARLRAASPAEA